MRVASTDNNTHARNYLSLVGCSFDATADLLDFPKMSANDRSFMLERKKGVPDDYERPLLYPIGDFEGALMGDIVRVADPDAAIELDRMVGRPTFD